MLTCRMCKGTGLRTFLDLGFTPPADQFLRREQLDEPEMHYPLRAAACRSCGLVQLDHVVSPEVLYRRDYPYEASITRMGSRHWNEFARSAVERFKLGPADLVVDIGSNVGVLLEAFQSRGTRALGVDPASNIVRIADKRGVETICEFFGPAVAGRIAREKGPASLITATNAVAHIDDLEGMINAVRSLLKPGGVFIFEAPYLLNLVNSLQYDTIYHEHLSYLSVTPLMQFLSRMRMEIFDIEQRDIHGGSFRVFIAEPGVMPVSPVVAELLQQEEAAGLHRPELLDAFARSVEKNRQDLLWLLRSLKHDGKRIAAVSAPAKGMTLLNFAGIGRETIDFVTEKSQLKIGRFTPGVHIPVVSDEHLVREMPEYALLLAWNFAEEIMENLAEYTRRGGKFIIPIPEPRVVGS